MPNPVPLGSPPASADDFKIYSFQPNVRFLTRGVQPPSNVYVGVNDDIVCTCASSQTNETVTVSYRLLRFDGQVVLGQFQVHPNNLRTVASHSEDLAEGFLLSVSCNAGVATTRGQTFVRIFLTDPALGGGQPSYMLMADYVTTAMAPGFPFGRVLAPTEGPGWIRTVTLANPPAGTDWLFNLPLNSRWRPICFNGQLATSAGGVNRIVRLQVTSGGSFVWIASAQASQAPSQFVNYCGAQQQIPILADTSENPINLPVGLILVTAGVIASNTALIGVADQWSLLALEVEEWIDNV